MTKKISENNLVVKSNSIIEASYRLTLEEQKIITVMASMIKLEDKDFQPIRIDIRDFARLLNLKDPNYVYMEGVTRQLLEKVLTIREQKSKLQIGWLSSAEYFKGEGCVELEFSPKLKPYLLQLKERFTKYYLQNVIQLSHSYSIRIYELLKQYEKINWRIFKVEQLRTILGIQPEEYKLYANLKKDVLKPSQLELKTKFENNEIDLYFNFEEIKDGRKVTEIKFIIFTKTLEPQKTIEILKKEDVINIAQVKKDQSEIGQNKLIEQLIFLLSPDYREKKTIHTLIDKYFKKYGFEYVKRNIEYANQNSKKNYRAYLDETLKKDYGLGFQEDQEQEKKVNFELKEGMFVEWQGIKCKIESGNVIRPYSDEGGSMPEGDIRKGIREGWIKILK